MKHLLIALAIAAAAFLIYEQSDNWGNRHYRMRYDGEDRYKIEFRVTPFHFWWDRRTYTWEGPKTIYYDSYEKAKEAIDTLRDWEAGRVNKKRREWKGVGEIP
jgi:hypothetical protein